MKNRGFTLIELLVVIGIIAVLSGVMLMGFGGSSESARAAKCLANMRSLAQAANTIAMDTGIYPYAGSFQRADIAGTKVYYYEYRGWISWLSNNGDPFGHKSGARPTNPVSCELPKFDDEEGSENALFAITNGTMWRAVNMNASVYKCPTHSLAFQKKHGGRKPLWSYVMNGFFGFDYSEGSKAVGWGLHREYGKLARADRIVMFAEIPILDPDGDGEMQFGDDASRDSVLQAKASVNGNNYGNLWKTSEAIGFNHKAERNKRCGHVAFADGHTEKFTKRQDSGLDAKQLTALLCNGKDVAFDGKGYEEIKKTD